MGAARARTPGLILKFVSRPDIAFRHAESCRGRNDPALDEFF
jgi:hypothetical protein